MARELAAYREAHTYVTNVRSDITPMWHHRYQKLQFMGFEGSASPSQSTSVGFATAAMLLATVVGDVEGGRAAGSVKSHRAISLSGRFRMSVWGGKNGNAIGIRTIIDGAGFPGATPV